MKKRLYVHPLFLILLLAGIACGQFFAVVFGLFSVVAHECGHYLAARRRGYTLNKLCLMPYGAMSYGGERIKSKDNAMIAVMGPLVNLAIATCCVALWWFKPSLYPYTCELFNVNVGIFCVNLLPVYPLDGGKIALSLFKNKSKGSAFLRSGGIVFGSAFIIAGIIGLFFGANVSVAVFGITLFAGAFLSDKEMQYDSVAAITNGKKKFERGVFARTVIISEDATLLKLFRFIDEEHYTDFIIIGSDPNKGVLCRLHEKDVGDIALRNSLNEKISRIIYQKKE